jgi:predicted O-methyltransferase YrrM
MISTLKRRLKDSGKKNLRRVFELGQHLGVDLLPRHFYSEIPDVRTLKQADRWKRSRSMVLVAGAETPEQVAFVEACCNRSIIEKLGHSNVFELACEENGAAGFGPIEADFLYCFIRTHRPARIVQIGSGVSTAVILAAASDADYRPELKCIDPYPTAYLHEADRRGLIELIPERAQDVSLELLTDLGEGGFFFVDSSHVVGPGSEVNRIIFEVLPRLERGTWVHFHDIFFPFDYQRGLMEDELFFSNESALLHAFLIGNARYTIRASLSMLHYAERESLSRLLPNYRPARDDQGLAASAGHFPASTYLQVVG